MSSRERDTLTAENKVIKEINGIFNRTSKAPSLAPYLCDPDPEVRKEAYEIWQEWMKTCDSITAHWFKNEKREAEDDH